jgi:hypothetical protein
VFKVGFVDGHLQLMRLHPQVGSWSNFVKFQFIKPLKMLLDAGCPRVVLCFDCYDNVPAYKNMTQTSRVSKHVVRPFAEGQELPEHIPEDPMSCLMNRRFKLKLIEMLCKQVPIMMKLMPGQILMIDYHCVVEYVGGQCPMIPMAVQVKSPTMLLQCICHSFSWFEKSSFSKLFSSFDFHLTAFTRACTPWVSLTSNSCDMWTAMETD